jgi:hypothetical protein
MGRDRFPKGKSAFSLAVRKLPTPGCAPPLVAIQMKAGGVFEEVIGKVDTGACRTVLTSKTAQILKADLHEDTEVSLCTATGEPLSCQSAHVQVLIPNNWGPPIQFPIQAAFSEKLQVNLFGIDWLEHLVLAFDRESVYFLRD